jgi:hypothetical protein
LQKRCSMSQPDFYTILDECVSRLRQGEPIAACLADYPKQAAELVPALALTADLIHLPRLEPAPDIAAQGYEKMMDAFAAQARPSRLPGVWLPLQKLLSWLKPKPTGRLIFVLRAAMVFLVVLAVGSAFVITASADSLPGDALYPVKRSWENTRLALTLAETSRQALELELNQRRQAEVQALLDLRRPAIVEFQGVLQSQSDGVWLVDDLSLHVMDDTAVTGTIAVGQPLFVRAQVQTDGTLVALDIVGDESAPPDRVVPMPTPRPTRTPAPTRTPLPTEPSPTHRPTERPSEPTRTPLPTREPTSTLEPTSLPTREPTATREPASTDKPAPADAQTPEPTATSDHRPPTDAPTNAPPDMPTPTPQPTDKPPRDDPTPTRESDSGGYSDHPP